MPKFGAKKSLYLDFIINDCSCTAVQCTYDAYHWLMRRSKSTWKVLRGCWMGVLRSSISTGAGKADRGCWAPPRPCLTPALPVFSAPTRGDPVGIPWRCLMLVKTRMIGLLYGEKLWRYVNPFSSDTGPLRTDGQTDGQICYQYRASVCCDWLHQRPTRAWTTNQHQ